MHGTGSMSARCLVPTAAAAALCGACPPRPPPAPPAAVPVVVVAPAVPPAAPAIEVAAAAEPAPALAPEIARGVAFAAAWLLVDEGPLVRVRFFVPGEASSVAPEFDRELLGTAEALRGAAPRLARVDVSRGPHDEAGVAVMRAVGILPRSGGEPEAVRAVIVAVGDALTPVAGLAPARGSAASQVLLAMHRVLRGPVRIGVLAAANDAAGAGALLGALADFALVRIDGATDPQGLAAVVVLASGAGPLPEGAAEVVRRALALGRGAVVLGGRNAVREGSHGLEVVRSPADPTPLLEGSGVAFEEGVVVDPSCARVSVPSGPGRLFLSYPPLVRTAIRVPGDGDAVGVLPFASPLRIDAGTAADVLARSSAESWVERGTRDWNPSRAWAPVAEQAAWPLVAAVTVPAAGPAPGAEAEAGTGAGGASAPDGGRLVVVSTAQMASGDGLTLEANAAILAGLVAWAADVEELLVLGASREGVER
jgi:hypothetical protein